MLTVEVTDQMLLTSREKAKAMGRLNRSITRGQGNLAGFVGEEIAAKVLNAKFDNLTKNIDYDLILPDGRTVDVKTKRTSVEPKSHYECSISTYYQQKCDLYAFVRVHNDLHTGWFLGIYDRDEFFKDCTHRKKGDVDPSNNFRFKSDTFNLKISQLRSAEYATTT